MCVEGGQGLFNLLEDGGVSSGGGLMSGDKLGLGSRRKLNLPLAEPVVKLRSQAEHNRTHNEIVPVNTEANTIRLPPRGSLIGPEVAEEKQCAVEGGRHFTSYN